MVRFLLVAICVAPLTSGCAPTKQEEYELSYDECKRMQSDESHRFWKQPIAIQGCELIISEVEIERSHSRK